MCFLLLLRLKNIEHKNEDKTENHARYFAYIGLHVDSRDFNQQTRASQIQSAMHSGRKILRYRFIVASQVHSDWHESCAKCRDFSNRWIVKRLHIQRNCRDASLMAELRQSFEFRQVKTDSAENSS